MERSGIEIGRASLSIALHVTTRPTVCYRREVVLEPLITRLAASLARRTDVRFAVLFGSTVSRGPASARDVDVAISWNRTPSWMEIGALASELDDATGKPTDIVTLDDASTLLRWEVLCTGLPIVVNDRDAWRDFQVRVVMEREDLRPFFEMESAGLRRSLERKRWSAST